MGTFRKILGFFIIVWGGATTIYGIINITIPALIITGGIQEGSIPQYSGLAVLLAPFAGIIGVIIGIIIIAVGIVVKGRN